MQQQRRAERGRALEYVKAYKGSELAWVLLGLMQDRAAEEKDDAERKKAYLDLAKAYEPFAEVFGEPLSDAQPSSAPLPLLKPTMTGLIRRIARRPIVPGRSCAQDPEHPIQDRATVLPGPAAPIRKSARPNEWFEDLPLGVSEVHVVQYDGPP